MMLRLVLFAALLAAGMAGGSQPAAAQSPFEFLRKQNQKQQRRQAPPPAATAPARPAPARPAAPATESAVPQDSAQPAAIPATVTKNTAPAPYEKDVRRIGEILGALHYLRPLCGADDGDVWKEKMRALIEAEGGPPDRRERLAGSFNEGYSGFQLTYRTCTPSANLAVERYLTEGAKLTREIATRHGN